MSRVSNILTNVRTDLGDADSIRYSDTVLLSYLNAGIIDFVSATKCLKERIYMGLSTSNSIYDLRPYVLEINRVEYLHNKIEAKTFEELDAINPDWQVATGTEVKYVTFEHLSKGMLRVYPLVTGAIDIINQNSLYGGLIDITINDDTYQIPSIADVESNLEQYLILYCLKKPYTVTLNTTDANMEIDASFDTAIIHYMKYRCLRGDTDAGNRAYGNEEFQLYATYVNMCRNAEAIQNNKVKERVIRYNGGFQ